jgi:hypothetical protein
MVANLRYYKEMIVAIINLQQNTAHDSLVAYSISKKHVIVIWSWLSKDNKKKQQDTFALTITTIISLIANWDGLLIEPTLSN